MELWDSADDALIGPLIDVLGPDADMEQVKALAETFQTWKAQQRAELWQEFTTWFGPTKPAGPPDFAINPQVYLAGMQQLLTKDLGLLREEWIRKGLLAIAEEPLLRFQWDTYLKGQKLSPADFWGVLQQMERNGQDTRHETTQTGFVSEATDTLTVTDDDPEEWLVDGMLPTGGFSVLGAKPKVGKSTFGFSLGWAIARGEPFLGRPTTQGRVLHFALEGVRQQDVGTLIHMGGHPNHMIRFGQQIPSQPYDVLAKTIEQEKLSLVLIDTIFRFTRVADLNDYGQVNDAFARLIELGQTTGCHIMAVHHLRKAKGEDVGDQILGSTAIYGSVDTYIDYQWQSADDETGDRVLFTRQRYGLGMPKTIIGLDVETGRIVSRGSAQDARRSTLEQAVLDAMPKEPGTPVSKSDLTDAVKGRRKDVIAAIDHLIAQGLLWVEKVGRSDMVFARQVDAYDVPI